MARFVLFAVFTVLLSGWLTPLSAGAEADTPGQNPLPAIPLSLNEVLAWIDRSHPAPSLNPAVPIRPFGDSPIYRAPSPAPPFEPSPPPAL